MANVRALYSTLFGADVVVAQPCDRIQLPRTRIRLRQATTDRVISVYQALYDAVTNPENGYKNPTTI